MKLKTGLILAVTVFMVFISANLVFSEDQTNPATSTSQIQATPEPQWVWAEVLSLDPMNHQMTIKYLDYEADTEKEMMVNMDDNTTYENVKSLSEIKPQDTVSIDYITTAQGSNIAKNINVEKSEGIQPLPNETIKTAPQAQTETAANPETTTNPANKELKPQGDSSPSKEQSPVSEKQE
jgi:hypothetical protein